MAHLGLSGLLIPSLLNGIAAARDSDRGPRRPTIPAKIPPPGGGDFGWNRRLGARLHSRIVKQWMAYLGLSGLLIPSLLAH